MDKGSAWSCLTLVLLVWSVDAFYLPGLSPTDFCREEILKSDNHPKCRSQVFVHVNKLDSTETIVPYEYFSFDFCPVQDTESKDKDPVENLGQVVFGERLRASPYEISFAKNETDKVLCKVEYRRKRRKDLEFLRERIHESYMHQWVIDNMPVTWCYQIMESNKPFCTTRFPVGCYVNTNGVKHDACYLSSTLSEPGATYVFNHHKIVISYHSGTEGNKFTDGRIVRAQVQLKSCESFPCKDKPLKLPKKIKEKETFTITYSYSIEFDNSTDIPWASRWDYILSTTDSLSYVQLFSLFNSLFLAIFLLPILATCMGLRHRKQKVDTKDLPSDVFSPPSAIMLLSVFVGNGIQITFTALLVLVIACLGFLSPANRGALGTAILVIYLLQSFVAGYISAAVYRLMGGLHWKSNVLMTSFFVSGIIFVVFFTLNLFLWSAGSSAAIPFTTLLALLCLWLGISVPLTFFGAYLSPSLKPRVGTQLTCKEVPEATEKKRCRFCACFLCSSCFGGAIPFGCVFIQLFFILNSIWSGSMYYQPGYVMLAYLFMLFVCVEMSVILSYLYLLSRDYHWWWRSFFSTGSTAFYFFCYSIQYFFYKTSFTGFFSSLLYFGYIFIMVFLFFLLTGSVGFIVSMVVYWKVYSTTEDDNEQDSAAASSEVMSKVLETDFSQTKPESLPATPCQDSSIKLQKEPITAQLEPEQATKL